MDSPEGTAPQYNVITNSLPHPKNAGSSPNAEDTATCVSRHIEECIWRFPIGRGFRILGVRQYLEDQHDVTLFFDWDSVDRARRFVGSEDLKQAMKQAGVVGDPDVRFLEDARTVRRSSAD